MPSDIRLDSNTHDLDISSGGLSLVTEQTEVLAQRIKITLLMRAGEWFRDINLGVPYITFSSVKSNKAFADTVLVSTITDVPDVLEVVSYSSILNAERKLEVSFDARTYSGTITDLQLEV